MPEEFKDAEPEAVYNMFKTEFEMLPHKLF
jgi:hypothetical protein